MCSSDLAVAAGVWIGIAVIIAGIALVARGENETGAGKAGTAILWSAAAALGFALTFAFAHSSVGQGDALTASLLSRSAACIVVGLCLLARRTSLRPAVSIWRTLLLMGTIDVSAMTLVILAGRFPEAALATITSSIFGLVTILLATIFLGEKVRPVQWLGALAVFSGIIVLALP